MADATRRLSLRARLTVAFVAVAVAAVAALAVVMLAATRSETGRLSADARDQTAAQVTEELARAYRAAGSWEGADLSGALALSQEAGAILIVRDGRGAVVGGGHFGRGPQAGRGAGMTAVSRAVDVGGVRAGTAELRFRGALTPAEALLRNNLVRAALLGSAIAIAIALAGAALVSRRLAEPLQRLTAAARRVQSGDLDARVDGGSAPGELGELSRAFDGMADALERQERARSRLASELAHELRTPVTILRGNLEELIDGDEQPTPARLALLHEEALRLGSLVEQLDALARAEAPVATLDREPVDLARLAAAQLEALGAAARRQAPQRREAARSGARRGRPRAAGAGAGEPAGNALKFTPETAASRWSSRSAEARRASRWPTAGPGFPTTSARTCSSASGADARATRSAAAASGWPSSTTSRGRTAGSWPSATTRRAAHASSCRCLRAPRPRSTGAWPRRRAGRPRRRRGAPARGGGPPARAIERAEDPERHGRGERRPVDAAERGVRDRARDGRQDDREQARAHGHRQGDREQQDQRGDEQEAAADAEHPRGEADDEADHRRARQVDP